jgi:hypothetical protein
MATEGSTSDIHARLAAFIVDEMGRPEQHACIKLELIYMPPGEHRRDPLKTWHRGNEVDRPYFDVKATAYLDRLVAEMVELAEYHADSFGIGKHRFKVVSHHAMGGGRHTHNFTMLPSAESSEGELVGASELDPSTGGITLQLMRHLENQQRLNKDMMTSFAGAMREAMTQLRTDNDRLHALIVAKDSQRLAELTEVEAARSKAHDQQIEAQLVVSETERKTFATKKIFGLLPVAISRFIEGGEDKDGDGKKAKLGKDGKAKPWKPSALSVALGELAESLTDEQQEVIENTLDIEQKIMLSEAIRLSKKGGAVMLPQIVHDLAASMQKEQLAKILGHLSGDQQQMFVRALQLAKAEVEPATHATKPDAGNASPPNGAAH